MSWILHNKDSSTATDTSIQSFVWHKGVGDATFVSWLRGKREHISDSDTSSLESVEPQAVERDGGSSVCDGSSAQHSYAARLATQVANTIPPPRPVDGWSSFHDCGALQDRRGP